MTMSKGDSRYKVSPRRVLFAEKGTELRISPLLEGIRSLSGEKIQWYLASELRDRIRNAKVRVTVIDKLARKQYEVEPRAYRGAAAASASGASAHRSAMPMPSCTWREPADSCRVALTRAGTRVIEDLATLPGLEHAPWSSRYLQGLIDVPFLNLTPGTRSGIIHDERYAALVAALQPLEAQLNGLIDEQRRAEEEQASQQSLRAIQRAFREALLALPPEEYDWFDVQARSRRSRNGPVRRRGYRPVSGADRDDANDLGVAEPQSPPGHNGSSSTTPARCSVSSSRRRRAPCRSTSGGASGRCRATGRAAASTTTCLSPGRSSKAADRSANAANQEVEYRRARRSWPRAAARHRDRSARSCAPPKHC